MKLKCGYCKEYVEKDDAYRVGISSFCNHDCYMGKKKDEWSGQRTRRAKRIADGDGVSEQTRTAVLVRDKGRCRACGKKLAVDSAHVHHIIYRSQGGPHTEENLITLCEQCHGIAHSNKRVNQPRLKEAVANNEYVQLFGPQDSY